MTLVLPILLYECETWTLARSLKQRLNSFGTIRRILECRWLDLVSNQRLLRETQMGYVTCTIRQRQLRLFGREADPARQVLYIKESTS